MKAIDGGDTDTIQADECVESIRVDGQSAKNFPLLIVIRRE